MSRVDRNKYQIQIPLPPKIDASVTMMQVEEKPDVTYSDVGGCKEQIEKLREVVETPLLHVGLQSMFLKHSITVSFSQNDSSPLGSTLLRGCYSSGLQVQGRRYARGLLQIVPMLRLSALLGLNLYKSMSGKAQEWSVNCSRWPVARKLASSSSTRSTPSVVHVLTMVLAGTTKYSGRCWS